MDVVVGVEVYLDVVGVKTDVVVGVEVYIDVVGEVDV